MKVLVARIYCTEGDRAHRRIFAHLHDHTRVRGVTVFRGISGFGRSGEVHSSTLLDMSLDLPVVIEFFDEAGRVERALDELRSEGLIQPDHVLTFAANLS